MYTFFSLTTQNDIKSVFPIKLITNIYIYIHRGNWIRYSHNTLYIIYASYSITHIYMTIYTYMVSFLPYFHSNMNKCRVSIHK